jgi:hypothetical protein
VTGAARGGGQRLLAAPGRDLDVDDGEVALGRGEEDAVAGALDRPAGGDPEAGAGGGGDGGGASQGARLRGGVGAAAAGAAAGEDCRPRAMARRMVRFQPIRRGESTSEVGDTKALRGPFPGEEWGKRAERASG